jgi:flagellar biosynthesis/type III secretory pathway chaperone
MENKWCDSCGKVTQWVNGECENYRKGTENGKVLAEKIDQYVKLVAKLDEEIAELKKQLTEKDISLDRKIGKLNQIRSLVADI